jgi:type IV pilus assembly protein PilC
MPETSSCAAGTLGESMSTGENSSPSPAEPGSPRSASGPLSADDLIALNEEIAGMARAGLPLDQGLAALAREMGRGRLQQVTRQLADDLRAGHTLPQALQRQEGRVPAYYAALLTAGIRSGRVSEVLGVLTAYARSLADFRAAVVSALVYPATVLALGLGLVVFTGAAILPGFVDIFDQMRLRLPLLTEWLLFIGAHPLETLVLPIVVAIVVPATVRWRLRSSPWGRAVWARLVYALPVAGTLIRSARLAAFTDLLGILVDQSIPLPEALRLAAEASGDPLLTEGAGACEQQLRQGLPLGAALQQQRLVPQLIIWMTTFGEKQGTLGATLPLLRTILPPLLIVGVAGFLVALFVFGVLAPMAALLEGLSGGKL